MFHTFSPIKFAAHANSQMLKPTTMKHSNQNYLSSVLSPRSCTSQPPPLFLSSPRSNTLQRGFSQTGLTKTCVKRTHSIFPKREEATTRSRLINGSDFRIINYGPIEVTSFKKGAPNKRTFMVSSNIFQSKSKHVSFKEFPGSSKQESMIELCENSVNEMSTVVNSFSSIARSFDQSQSILCSRKSVKMGQSKRVPKNSIRILDSKIIDKLDEKIEEKKDRIDPKAQREKKQLTIVYAAFFFCLVLILVLLI